MEKFHATIFYKMPAEKYVIKANVGSSNAKAVEKALLEKVPDDPRKTMQLHTHAIISCEM